MDISFVDVVDVARLHIVAATDAGLSGRRIIASARFISMTDFCRCVRRLFKSRHGLGPALCFTWPEGLFEAYERLTHPKRVLQSVVRPTRAGIARSRSNPGYDNGLAEGLLGGFISTDETVETTGESLIALGVVAPAGGRGWTSAMAVAAAVAAASAAVLLLSSSRGRQ